MVAAGGLAAVLTNPLLGLAQTTTSAAKFDVESVKISADSSAASRFRPTGSSIDGRNGVLKLVLNYAYGVDGFNISGGPGWINSERFDIQAKAAPNTPDSRATRSALRFNTQLTVVLPVYQYRVDGEYLAGRRPTLQTERQEIVPTWSAPTSNSGNREKSRDC